MKHGFLFLVGFLGCLCYSTPVSAHPGHGESGPGHYFNSAEHIIPLVVLALMALVCAGYALKRKPRPFSSK